MECTYLRIIVDLQNTSDVAQIHTAGNILRIPVGSVRRAPTERRVCQWPALGIDVSLCIEIGWSFGPSIADCITRANNEENKGV